jgi:hypothetical protein
MISIDRQLTRPRSGRFVPMRGYVSALMAYVNEHPDSEAGANLARAKIGGPSSQKINKLFVRVLLNEAGAVTARATVSIPRAAAYVVPVSDGHAGRCRQCLCPTPPPTVAQRAARGETSAKTAQEASGEDHRKRHRSRWQQDGRKAKYQAEALSEVVQG